MPDYTLGMLNYHEDHDPLVVLEDQYQEVKVKGETCIPEGKYRLVINRQLTPLTQRYQKKYPWFKYFLEIDGIKGFDKVYPHIGNSDEDTAGCPLLGTSCDLSNPNGWVGGSTPAFKKFYETIYPLVESGAVVWWETTLMK